MVKALKPLNLKKDRRLLTGLLTHKIVREILEPDSLRSPLSFLESRQRRSFRWRDSTQNLDAALLSTCSSPRQDRLAWIQDDANFLLWPWKTQIHQPLVLDFLLR
jgi:hypothetical protein